MTKRSRAAQVVCCLALALYPTLSVAGSNGSASPVVQEQAEPLTASQWRADLHFMASEMERIHKDLYHTVSRSAFQQEVVSLHDRIPGLQRHEIIVGLMRIAALVGDGHTNVSPHRDAAIGFSMLPAQFYLFEDGLYVRAASANQHAVLGARVEAFNGVPVKEALARVNEITAADNPVGALAHIPIFMQMPEVLHALGLSESASTARLTLSRDGRVWDTTLQASEPFAIHRSSDTDLALAPPPAGWLDAVGSRPIWLQAPQTTFRMQPMPEHEALYVQLNRVVPDQGQSLGGYGRQVRDAAAEMGARKVVLDIRLNRGGDGSLLPPFVRELVKMEDENTQLFLLTGRGTFSAAQFLADQLDMFSEAVLIGEPTGSKPNVMGDSRRIVLPNSGISVRTSIYWWQLNQDHEQPWTAPAIAAPLTFADFAAGRDPALEAVLSYQPPMLLSDKLVAAILDGGASADQIVEDHSAIPANRFVDIERELLLAAYGLFGLGRMQDAIDVLELNVRRFPQSADAHYYLASAYQALGRLEEALRAVMAALALKPRHPEAMQLEATLRSATQGDRA